MRPLLARGNIEVVAQAAWAKLLVAFDYDGTLAPIVRDRDAVDMRRRTRSLLSSVCERYPCAVISGRSQRDVSRRLAGIGVKWILGNHGLEPGARNTSQFAAEIARVRGLLERRLGHADVDIEDKVYSLALHYRRSRRKRDAREMIRTALDRLPSPVRVIPGKLVVNVLPRDAPDKGLAVLRLREEAAADSAIYIGDDETDEDVFCLDQPGRLLGVRIGFSRTSAAPFFLRDQKEVDALLETLVLCSKEHPHDARIAP